MSIRLSGIGYPVRDLALARAFYEVLFERAPTLANAHQVLFEIDGVRFQLAPDLRRDPPSREGILIGWCVPDLERTVARAEGAGGKCVLRRAAGELGEVTAGATVTDPFGNYIALRQA